MAKRRGKGPRDSNGGGGGANHGHGGRASRPGKRAARATTSSAYFMQPGKRGAVVVLRKPCGNRISPKVCGMMPSRVHAKMLITQLERAETVVKDLFLEATDDGIEALEAVLAACCEEVLKRGPSTGRRQRGSSVDEEGEDAELSDDSSNGADPVPSARSRSENPAA